MSSPGSSRQRARAGHLRRVLTALLGAGMVACGCLFLAGLGSRPPRAAAAEAAGEVAAQSDVSVPARDVTMIGSSPVESAGETWGVGETGTFGSGAFAIVRYTAQSQEWSVVPGPFGHAGHALAVFQPDRTPLAGSVTPGGDGALLGIGGEDGAKSHELLLLRSPGGEFEEVPLQDEGENLLGSHERLFEGSRTPTVAPVEEANGHAGAFVVPVDLEGGGNEERVLHYDGEHWSSEPIQIPAATEEEGGGLRVLALADSSPSNAWLLAQLSSKSSAVALFHRREGRWQEVTPAPLTDEGQPFAVSGGGTPEAQVLTVTAQGVWIDGERADLQRPVTMFFVPGADGEAAESGEVRRAWCDPGEEFEGCNEQLPEALPTGPWRSFAWANGSTPYGERVLAGFEEGITLRLEGSSFTRVLSLGGSAPPDDVGGSLGAAFAGAREGWLGNEYFPVRLTMAPTADQLQNYPVPFRHALTAIAAEPGAPAAALTSEALAVGDDGQVARWMPAQGWVPETLFGPGGRHETPRLRAVAWPSPSRAYAVGALGQMWLWRAETDLWEPDPATPLNFKGNLLGVAFAPEDPSRGYAVGQQGVLLRYGKTWVQEPEEALPPEARGASFTSIAFSGSEALVAFREMHLNGAEQSEPDHYTGGLLVNDGSGWQIDSQAEQALEGAIPWEVAGLPDGGAAIEGTVGGLEGQARVVERQSASAPWEATPAYPGTQAPGSLALFREAGALRAVAAGAMPDTAQVEEVRPTPVGFPPVLIGPYPLADTGFVVRQTASGWRDEEHAQDPVRDPLGEYKFFDLPYQPDPAAAVLVNETGSAGWVVGGFASQKPVFDTADVSRYPAEAQAPPGVGTAPVESNPARAGLESSEATFALGGDAQCEAACANRARDDLGPDTWLQSTVHEAETVPGLRAFLYTGPHVTSGVGHGEHPVDWSRELVRYAEVLGADAGPAAVFPAASPTDRAPGSECEFQSVFAGFPEPLGDSPPPAGVAPLAAREVPLQRDIGACATYYAFRSSGMSGEVRVVMLDTSAEGGEWIAEQAWLASELGQATAAHEPAIVVGNANLNAEIAAHSIKAAEAARTIIAGRASAYFYDAPEENIEVPLDGSTTPAFGSGTLGYVSAVKAAEADFVGASGFLLAHVDVAARAADNVAPVSVRLVPDVGELAMEAEQGTLLRRSQVANFVALARRPRAGGRSQRGLDANESDLYIPLPENCIGTPCAHRILPEFTFVSSDPEVGNFVMPNLASSERNAVLLGGSKEEPVPDPESGLFCAFNKGETNVTIDAGGFSSTLRVVVQAGSVRRPCGTVPIKPSSAPVTAPPPPPAPTPQLAPGQAAPPPVVPPAPAAPVAAPAPKAVVPPPLLPQAPAIASPLGFLPPPPPTPARPTPPSGTSAVTSPVEVAEKEEESEEAPESVSAKAVAYSASEHEPAPEYLLGLILLAAFAGVAGVRGARRGRRQPRVAPATLATSTAQRRHARRH